MGSFAEARAELYAAFSDFDLPDGISYCSYCDDADYERALHAPLAELSDTLVDKYVADAFHHTGGVREFMHFLPRALDLFHSRRQSLSSVEILARCIGLSEPASWPPGSREAFQNYLVASFVADVLAGPDMLVETGFSDVRFADHVALGVDPGRLVAAWPRGARGATYLARLIWRDDDFGRLAELGGIAGEASRRAGPDPAIRAFIREGRAVELLRSALPQLAPYDQVDVEVAIEILEGLASQS